MSSPDVGLKNRAMALPVNTAMHKPDVRVEPKQPGRSWHQSLVFDLSVATVCGLLYALWVMGPGPLNPRNVDWLTPDPAYHYVGWELFRQDPAIHFPLTYTNRIGYPYGESVSLLDLNPLLALVLKLLSGLLPEPCQYFGIEIVLAGALQFFFAARLLRLLLKAGSVAVLMCSAFFLLSPPLNYRLVGHYSLSNHWLVIAALYVFFAAQQNSPGSRKRFVLSAIALTAVSVGINPYLAFQVVAILGAAVVSLLVQRRLTLSGSGGVLAALVLSGVAVAYCFGFIISGGRGYSSGGYRYYSLNLLSLIDPYAYGSIVFPRLPQATGGQYEGYNYLGAGAVALTLIVLVFLVVRRAKLNVIRWRPLLPLLTCCGLLTLMAFSTKVTIGSRVLVDLDPTQRVSGLFAPLRATGRLFWAPYYALLASIVAAPFFFVRKTWAYGMLACTLVFQVADTTPLRHWVHATVNGDFSTPLTSPIWSKLGASYQNLVVLPAWQCDVESTPGEKMGYRIFGYLAVRQKMRTNSFNSARYTEAARDLQCTQAVSNLIEKPLSPDTAYVVSPTLAALIANGPSGPGRCRYVDAFILCSAEKDIGTGPQVVSPTTPLSRAITNADFETPMLNPWASFEDVQGSITDSQAYRGTHSLMEVSGVGSYYQDITGLQPGHVYSVLAWVKALPSTTATAQIALFDPTANVATFSSEIRPGPAWQVLTHSVRASGDTLRIHLFRNGGTGSIYWDDVRIYEEK